MSDEQTVMALATSGKLSTDQLMLLHLNGTLRGPPSVRVLIVGSVPGFSDELATFHEALGHELVRRGVAAYA